MSICPRRFPHQRMDLAPAQLKPDAVKRLYTREDFGYVAYLQDNIVHAALASRSIDTLVRNTGDFFIL